MSRFAGIDLNGVVDRVALGDPSDVDGETVAMYGPSITFPHHKRERPIVGPEAAFAVDGLSWADATAARWWVRDGLDLLRGSEATAPVLVADGAKHRVGDLIGRHVQSLAPAGVDRVVLTMPDVWVDVGQQALLDGMGLVRSRTELLWRPVATLLAWGDGMQAREVEGDVAVAHLGPDAPEVAVYEITWERVDDRWLLVPVRRGPGQALDVAPLHQDGLATWWRLTAERAGVVLDDVRAAETGWRSIVGDAGPPAYLRRSDGSWATIDGGVDSGLLVAYAESVASSLLAQLGSSERVVLEGSSGRAGDGDRRVAEVVAARLRMAGHRVVHVAPSGAAAVGAVAYARRRHHGWPTYLDVLPSLAIQALSEGRPTFVTLVPEGERVRGGSTFDGREVGGFSVAAGTESLTYYLARGDEPTVRSTTTPLKAVPAATVPLALRVRQKPAQGFAEVRIGATDLSGWPTVALDWSTMSDTGETRDALLERLAREQGYAYPSVEPFPASVVLWRFHNVDRVLDAFFSVTPSDAEYKARLHALLKAFQKKGDPESLQSGVYAGSVSTHGVIGSNGELPEDGDRHAAEQRARAYELLLNRIEADFAVVSIGRHADATSSRRLKLVASWCYLAAPGSIAEFARGELLSYFSPLQAGMAERRYAANFAERSFHSMDDTALLFKVAETEILPSGLLGLQWIRAAAYLLRFRESAPYALDRVIAVRLARVAVRTMRSHLRAANVERLFFSAAMLLVALLRFRAVDPSFLTPDDVATGTLLADGKSVLGQARRTASGAKRDRIVGLVDAIDAYLEGRGTDALIFSKLEALGGDAD